MNAFHKDVRINDRVLARSGPDVLHFYYKGAARKEEYLFTTPYSPSVYAYFGGQGKTVRQIYGFREWHNTRLSKTVSRIPSAVKYAMIEKEYEKEERSYDDYL